MASPPLLQTCTVQPDLVSCLARTFWLRRLSSTRRMLYLADGGGIDNFGSGSGGLVSGFPGGVTEAVEDGDPVFAPFCATDIRALV